MLMSIRNIAKVTTHNGVTKGDVSEVVSKGHNKGRSKVGRRSVKRAEKQRMIRDEIGNR